MKTAKHTRSRSISRENINLESLTAFGECLILLLTESREKGCSMADVIADIKGASK